MKVCISRQLSHAEAELFYLQLSNWHRGSFGFAYVAHELIISTPMHYRFASLSAPSKSQFFSFLFVCWLHPLTHP